jgi:hypothetical protein
MDEIDVFLQETSSDALAMSEHGENEITQFEIAGYSVLSYFCLIMHESGGI